MIIAVDGPAASGKGTIARALARHYALPHLDTGLLYRAVARRLLDDGSDPADQDAAAAACDFDDALLGDPRLKADDAGKVASIVSAHPAVRAALIERQKRFARQDGGAVLDGRDIGTVIAPDADAKLFVRATSAIRARRRHDELRKAGSALSYDRVLADLKARDLRDTTRAAAPLRQAPDAVALDTSFLSVESAISHAIEIVERCRSAKIP
ncbi:cytidylate kinase [Sphingomonas jejuensis]|uniref:Cytidylate kinase n=1 Tax=Sphingomonas jejuensis TaxID=904715 RepID=A0ABX0XMZ5_9SPHN|nr:(d)CMP kinase [Sphingomonas jejuensis]NJC34111.1 cytidylate kinase [Sphingomonas jejuensis]